MCNNQSYFVNYRAVYRFTTVQDAEGVLSAIGIGNIPLTVETRSGERNDVLLIGVLHIPGLFTNLISGSELLKKGYYFHYSNQTINSCTNNAEIASAPIRDGLFALRLYKRPKKSYNVPLTPLAKAATSRTITLIQTWHRRLGHPSYANLKRFGNARGIDMSKFKMENDLFFCQICIRAKQHRHSFYKPQSLADDICEELHVNLIDLITPAGWNGCRYTLTITDSHPRCR